MQFYFDDDLTYIYLPFHERNIFLLLCVYPLVFLFVFRHLKDLLDIYFLFDLLHYHMNLNYQMFFICKTIAIFYRLRQPNSFFIYKNIDIWKKRRSIVFFAILNNCSNPINSVWFFYCYIFLDNNMVFFFDS